MILRFDETISTAGLHHESFDPLADLHVAREDMRYIRWQKKSTILFYDVNDTSMKPPQVAFI